MDAAELHPLRTGEAIDASFTLYRRRPLPLLRRSALVVWPAYLIIWVVSIPSVHTIGDVSTGELLTPRVPGQFPLAAVDQTTVGFWVSILVGIAMVALVVGAGARPAVAGYLGDRAEQMPSRAHPMRAATLVAVLTLLGLLALVVGAYLVQAALFVAAPAAVVEGTGAGVAVRRSARLGRGRMILTVWWITLLQLIIVLITATSSFLVLGLFVLGDLTNTAVFLTAQLIVGAVMATVTMPLLTCLSTVAYFDRRIRAEGFDLALLVQDVGRISATPTFAEADRRLGSIAVPRPSA